MSQPREQDRFLDLVTIIGADDSVRHEDLLRLAQEYPFVEFGILLDPELQGRESGYPSQFWLFKLRRLAAKGVRLSGHIGGQWARDVLDGSWALFKQWPWLAKCLSRLQVDVPDDLHNSAVRFSWPFGQQKTLIVAGNDGLLQHARSRGVPAFALHRREASDAPWSPHARHAGYAGCLSHENVRDELPRIRQVTQSAWICAGSSLRRDGKFSIAKAAAFLEASRHWVYM